MRTEEFYKEIGKRIRRIRKEKGITQEALADMIYLERTSITNIEKGRQKMLIHTLFDLAEALHVDPCYLLPTVSDQVQKGHVNIELPLDLSSKEQSWIKHVISEPVKRG